MKNRLFNRHNISEKSETETKDVINRDLHLRHFLKVSVVWFSNSLEYSKMNILYFKLKKEKYLPCISFEEIEREESFSLTKGDLKCSFS
ncbi:hypothetical protein BpHYR1_040507 [Brachionus plicatilis]|uniref:Uncharacterized protein n=1 Tax=Brachionus plicatilis TaxID=10195 RepID=A0A3M7RML5_BRAPC|nr:hypothetical protein BpHYR1_040507 [Brachionus plicatilis]